MKEINNSKNNFFFQIIPTIRSHMQWNNKYNYPKSTRSIFKGSRHYTVNQENLPSVTTILKATESEEKKAKLDEWKKGLDIKMQKLFLERQLIEAVQCTIIWKNFYQEN